MADPRIRRTTLPRMSLQTPRHFRIKSRCAGKNCRNEVRRIWTDPHRLEEKHRLKRVLTNVPDGPEARCVSSNPRDNLTFQAFRSVELGVQRYAAVGHRSPTPRVAPELRLRTFWGLAQERPARKAVSNVLRFGVARCHLQAGYPVLIVITR